jgi:cytochrome c
MKGMGFIGVLLIALLATSCERTFPSEQDKRNATRMTGGDPERGRQSIRAYGCNTCHTIPGVQGAIAYVGPPLEHMGSRTYIAGEVPNTPANMVRWIQSPHSVEQHTAMPEMNVTEEDARNITAYLYSLK